MNSFIEYIPESYNDHRAFVELILSIIDTKLQFIKDRTTNLINAYHREENETFIAQHIVEGAEVDLIVLLDDMKPEKIFEIIEVYSKTTNLLLVLRASLTTDNVSRIYDLLSKDRYLYFDNEELQIVINGKKVSASSQ